MRILYICTGNCFRSPVAEALTRRYKPELEVESAGVRPTGHIAGSAKDLLQTKDALDFVKGEPDPITQRAIDSAERIIVMEGDHRDYLLENFQVDGKSIESWDVDDPINPDVEPGESFEEIEAKVKNL